MDLGVGVGVGVSLSGMTEPGVGGENILPIYVCMYVFTIYWLLIGKHIAILWIQPLATRVY